MAAEFSVRLTARQEGIEYRTSTAVHRFDVLLVDGAWQLYLPGSRGEAFAPHELTESEAAEILPRVVAYLATERLLGVPIGRRAVHVHRRAGA